MNKEERKTKEKELDAEQGEELKREIRSMLGAKGYTLEKLAQELCEKYHVRESKANLSSKLSRGSLRYIDVVRIAKILGYNIEIKAQKS